jgi:hypothetical protein
MGFSGQKEKPCSHKERGKRATDRIFSSKKLPQASGSQRESARRSTGSRKADRDLAGQRDQETDKASKALFPVQTSVRPLRSRQHRCLGSGNGLAVLPCRGDDHHRACAAAVSICAESGTVANRPRAAEEEEQARAFPPAVGAGSCTDGKWVEMQKAAR